jgi:uncharacterized membrane protein
VAVLLGLLVAVGFGSGDFLGGRAARRAPLVTVLLLAQATAVLGAVGVSVAVSARVGVHDLVFGAFAGVANVSGLALLYRGLARGPMGVVAPMSAITAALVPVAWGLGQGERPSVVVWTGVVCAVAAGALIGSGPRRGPARGGGAVLLALVAGAVLGSSLILFAQTSSRSGLWPVLGARVAAVTLLGAALLVLEATRRRPRFPSGEDRVLALGAGALDVAASTFLLLAVRRGLLVVVAPVACLAPGFTVVLARIVIGERPGSIQRVGLALALVGLVLVAAG